MSPRQKENANIALRYAKSLAVSPLSGSRGTWVALADTLNAAAEEQQNQDSTITFQGVAAWTRPHAAVPPHWAQELERLFGPKVCKAQLRPDIYPDARE